ncbi:TetR/AcrR family transcriptional regulator [Roseibacterium sp. SDUM158017]|uniref:TetR/AcrR family transcriptional regulator n=1 Tax=Roseicyclus salinarum TaxID=3036773 RepID=UPI0024154788|nr:TetR/AcrR family transcriptional regulator [Roseibacterium sp. SDUM158017]MDG4647940.1 TetR/AcrR family transcriptional regulator [Roseibacterium sp. SDUM158017]
MARPKPDLTALLDAMADHVLTHGLNTASLRPLARTAGTSDRMLVYHFGSKEGLVAALLQHLASRMANGLTAALPPGRAESVAGAVAEIVALMRTEAFRPYARVWLDIVSASGQGGTAHRAAGHAVIDGFLSWIAGRLPERDGGGAEDARLALTLIEGTLVMDAVGQSDTADRAVARMAEQERAARP